MFEPSRKQRALVLVIAAVVILGIVNFQIASKERIVADGSVVLLELAPRDPRSLIQGDYMALRYSIAEDVAAAAQAAGTRDGVVVVRLDSNGVARFEHLDDGSELEPGQHLLQFRKRGDTVRLASDAYFFEEGEWETYGSARFGELRVDSLGNAVLTGLRDANLEPLGALHRTLARAPRDLNKGCPSVPCTALGLI